MKKLSLDAFKEKAEHIQEEDVLKKIQGGLSDCHGFFGRLAKGFHDGGFFIDFGRQ